LVPIHLSLTGKIRIGLMQLVDEVIDRHLPVFGVPELFEEPSPATISNECETRIETVVVHGMLFHA
jgi:hypothetical protein